MAIAAVDIKYFLSGGAGNSDPNASLGGIISTTQVAATLHNLFDKVTGDEGAAGDSEYRCFYLKNDHGSLTWEDVKLWISGETANANTQLDLALAGEGLNGTAETIADESTAPVGESFTHPTTKAGGLSLGNMAAGDVFPIWVKRVVTAAAPVSDDDTGTLSTEGDTPA